VRDRAMRNAIEIWAPWMAAEETDVLIEQILQLPPQERRPSGKVVGQRLNLTNAERESFQLWTISPADMTNKQMAEQRKVKQRLRERRRRQKSGAKTRREWLAASRTGRKPWLNEGVSRATWYRRRQGLRQVRAQSSETETGPCEINS